MNRKPQLACPLLSLVLLIALTFIPTLSVPLVTPETLSRKNEPKVPPIPNFFAEPFLVTHTLAISTAIVSPFCLLIDTVPSRLRIDVLLGVERANVSFRPLRSRSKVTFILNLMTCEAPLLLFIEVWISLAVATPSRGPTTPFAYLIQSLPRTPKAPSGTTGTRHPTLLSTREQCLASNTLFRGAHRNDKLLFFLSNTQPELLGIRLICVRIVRLTRTATVILTFFKETRRIEDLLIEAALPKPIKAITLFK